MQFSVGDNVVHPNYGPGRIASVTQWEVKEEARAYYVIEIPGQALTVYVPALKADEVGVRPAMSQSRLEQVMRTLRSKPRRLPDDYKERQEQVNAEIKTGHVLELAKVVRDLTWHRERAHLTKIDADLLKEGWDLLAAEMALVSGVDISDSSRLIGSTVDSAQAGFPREPSEPASH
ncbi:MAG: CarD family transcriptional regulator [Anaerolineae bacterium]|jgi:CarD family transcriptional regulator